MLVTLNDWCIASTWSPYTAPELMYPKLYGNCEGHPRHTDGTFIVTSDIVSVDGEQLLSKSGTKYVLGNPAADYEEMFPNAKQRLIEHIRSFANA